MCAGLVVRRIEENRGLGEEVVEENVSQPKPRIKWYKLPSVQPILSRSVGIVILIICLDYLIITTVKSQIPKIGKFVTSSTEKPSIGANFTAQLIFTMRDYHKYSLLTLSKYRSPF